MTYALVYHPKVAEDVRAVSRDIRARLSKAIHDRLTTNPEHYGKPLRGTLAGYWTLLKRRGLIDPKNDASESETPPTVRDGAPGIFADIDDAGRVTLSPPLSRRKPEAVSLGANTCGFSIDASVRIPSGDLVGRELQLRTTSTHSP